MILPLTARWRLRAGEGGAPLSERSMPAGEESAPLSEEDAVWDEEAAPLGPARAFALPGADELAAFSDLLGDAPAIEAAPPSDEPDGAPFALPGALPPEAAGDAVLARRIDFGRLVGEHAALEFGLLAGRGEIFLDGARLGAFDGGPLTLDVTEALCRARAQTLELRFDGTRPAGVLAPVSLRVARYARLLETAVLPDAEGRTMTVRARVHAFRAGTYLLRASFIARGAGAPEREIAVTLAEGEERALEMALDAPAERFQPGTPYDAPAIRARLWLREGDSPRGALCDEALLACGYPGSAPRFWLPLTRADCAQSPDALAGRLRALGIPCAAFPDAKLAEAALLAFTRAGLCARIPTEGRARLARFPCAVFGGADLAYSRIEEARLDAARALCGMVAYPGGAVRALSPGELLDEAAGRPVDPDDAHTAAVLAWLRAVLVRLRAEAMRRGMLSGALCLPGEWDEPDVEDALRAALAPVHLSSLPLYGAWWTRARFSASLHAFAPGEAGLVAEASLEDEDGEPLARVRRDVPTGGGPLGLLDAPLPDFPCALTLRARLLRGERTLEESAFPVYVGERGPLERAF